MILVSCVQPRVIEQLVSLLVWGASGRGFEFRSPEITNSLHSERHFSSLRGLFFNFFSFQSALVSGYFFAVVAFFAGAFTVVFFAAGAAAATTDDSTAESSPFTVAFPSDAERRYL